MFDINSRIVEKAEQIKIYYEVLETEREIGRRNTFTANIKEEMIELERLWMLKNALELADKLKPKKAVKKGVEDVSTVD